MSYRVKEIYATFQGEGALAGMPAVFVRLAGCNLWSGRGADRADGCSAFCDTDFVGGDELDAGEIVERVREAMPGTRLVVLTGGEPLLQVDRELIFALHLEAGGSPRIAIETNGTCEVPMEMQAWLWITVSPKVPAEAVKQRWGDEVKVVWPDYDPEAYESLRDGFRHFLVQPRAPLDGSPADSDIERAAAEWCLAHPRWRLSLQTHKRLGLP